MNTADIMFISRDRSAIPWIRLMRASILQVKWEKRYADRSSRYVTELSCKNRIRLLNTTLAFEYSTVDAEIHGKIDSVMNPASGIIRADEIGS